MRKTSVYLRDAESRRLAELAELEGRPRAEIIRDAIAAYEPTRGADRNFELAGAGRGPGGSVADLTEEDLLEGFGN